MQKIRGIFINSLLSLFAVAIFLLSFEIVLRVLGINCAITNANGEGIYVISNDSYYMKPYYDGRFKCLEFDSKIRTNYYGYRDSEFNATEKVILLFGDSMVFGQGVEQNETIADVLEKLIGQYGFVVYNLGISGYSPKEYLKQMREWSEKIKSGITIIMLYEGNDAQENCGILKRIEKIEGKRKGIGKIKDLLKMMYSVRFTEPLLRNIVDIGDSKLTSRQFYLKNEPANVKECNQELKKNMNALNEMAKKHNQKILFVILPSTINFMESKEPSLDYNKKISTILDFCHELNTTCFNLKEHIKNQKEIYLKEGHLSKNGNKVIATLINDFLIKDNFFLTDKQVT